jgi:hypothetical protein
MRGHDERERFDDIKATTPTTGVIRFFVLSGHLSRNGPAKVSGRLVCSLHGNYC